MGNFEEIQSINRQNNDSYDALLYSYARWSENQKLIVVANFSSEKGSEFDLKVPSSLISKWNLKDGEYQLKDQLYQNKLFVLKVQNGQGEAKISIQPSESLILELK